jgi:hypothetical protein
VVPARGVATVDCQGLAGDERGIGRHQEQRRGGDLLGAAEAAELVLEAISSRIFSIPGIPNTPSSIGVSMNPGQMALARMPARP